MNGTRLRRRDFLASAAATVTLATFPARAFGETFAAVEDDDVAWLDETLPTDHEGLSWGQPWPRGTRYRKRRLRAGG